MTQRIAITGVDGTGKTTLVRSLMTRGSTSNNGLRAFRVPQYHEDPAVPFRELSIALDQLSILGDQRKDPVLKATALFLSITLFGDIEAFYQKTFQPRFLFSERQALVDSLVYALFYQKVIQGPLPKTQLEAAILDKIGAEGWRNIEEWLVALDARGFGKTDFWNAPLVLKSLFEKPAPELLPALMRLCRTDIPDALVILTVPPEHLEAKMQAKQNEGASPRELHEQVHVLDLLQKGLLQTARALQGLKPSLRVEVIETSSKTPADTLQTVSDLFNLG